MEKHKWLCSATSCGSAKNLVTSNKMDNGGEQMNHELVMLRGALRMKQSAKDLNKTIRTLALKYYSTLNFRDGTMGQVEAICNYTEKRNSYLNFYNGVAKALKRTPKGYRALICEVYLRKTDKQSICQKYKVSLSTLYRYLSKARKKFRDSLNDLGYSESWLTTNYQSVPWVAEMLKTSGKGRAVLFD